MHITIILITTLTSRLSTFLHLQYIIRNGCYVLSASYGGLRGEKKHMCAVVYTDTDDALLGQNADWGSSDGMVNEKSMKQQVIDRLSRARLTRGTYIDRLFD